MKTAEEWSDILVNKSPFSTYVEIVNLIQADAIKSVAIRSKNFCYANAMKMCNQRCEDGCEDILVVLKPKLLSNRYKK